MFILSWVSNVLSNNDNGSPIGRPLVVNIHRLPGIEWKVVVHHSYCEVNQCDDILENFGYLNVNVVYYETCSTQFSLLVDIDVSLSYFFDFGCLCN